MGVISILDFQSTEVNLKMIVSQYFGPTALASPIPPKLHSTPACGRALDVWPATLYRVLGH